MKKAIHPKYYSDCQVTCACGNTFSTGSTLPEIKVEICASCHPFFTGKMKFIDTMGRVEKFQAQMKSAQANLEKKKTQQKKDKTKQARPSTLKEMIQQQKKKKLS